MSNCPDCERLARGAAHHPRPRRRRILDHALHALRRDPSRHRQERGDGSPTAYGVVGIAVLTPADICCMSAASACCTSQRRLPFSRRRTRPIFRPWRRIPTLPKNPAKPRNPKRQVQGVAARRAADRAGAGGTAQSRDQPRRCRHGLGHRPAAAAGQFLGPPRRRRGRRASRAGLDARTASVASAMRSLRATAARLRRCEPYPQPPGARQSRKASTKPRKPITAPRRPSRRSIRNWRSNSASPTAEDDDEALARPPRNKMEALGVKATADALENLIRDGRPEFKGDDGQVKIWTPHRPPRPEKSEGGVPLRDQVRIRAEGRPADRDQGTGRGHQAQRPHPGAARRHRLRQDLHHGQGDRGDAAPRHHPGAEQDAGGAALWRVQEFLPRQRGGVFRQLLRLLPARGLCAAHRHLYREGLLDQRADRPHAPLGDARAAGARRRHHRRLGVVHLRYRLGRDLYRDDLCAEEGRAHRPAAVDRRPRGAAIQAHPGRFHPRHLSRPRRRHRHLPGAL